MRVKNKIRDIVGKRKLKLESTTDSYLVTSSKINCVNLKKIIRIIFKQLGKIAINITI